jgi:Zn-dependent membrane protease YugP
MIIILASLVITLGAQAYINSMYKKTKKIEISKGMTGAIVARKILDNNGLNDVKINESSGILSDHYDPRNKTVNLSPEVFCKASVAAVSVAAHECGHAIQDKNGYFFLKFRNSIVPFVNIASYLGYISIVVGLFLSVLDLIWLGIIMEFVILFFQLITLPVEFNASNRALKELFDLNIVSNEEMVYSKKMLFAAALTYVASVATAVLQIVRLLLMVRRND